jgi:hypothetical protein
MVPILRSKSGRSAVSATNGPTELVLLSRTGRHSRSREIAMQDYVRLFGAIAGKVLQGRLSTGARVLDPTDFREWLIELAAKAEQAETLEEFLSHI